MDVGKSKKIREGHRQATRKLIHTANEAINAVSEAETLNREDKVKLRLNKNLLTEQDKNLEEFNSKILAGIKKVEDIEEEALEALEFKQEIQRVLVQIELLLEGDEIARQSRQESQNLSEIDKSDKSGKAATTLVAGFSLTAENYGEAIKLLKERYANPQLIISSHMEKLLKLNTVHDANDVLKLRALYDQIETNICSLNVLGIKPEQFGSLLVP
ncbi:Hypothetical predicted protein, partial [Paramuricea clavata]